MGSLEELLSWDAQFIYLFIYFYFFWNVCLSYLCLFVWNEKMIDILIEKDWFIACFKLFPVLNLKENLYLSTRTAIWSDKSLLAILLDCLLIYLWLIASVIAYWKHLSSIFLDLLLISHFWSIKENLCMIRNGFINNISLKLNQK